MKYLIIVFLLFSCYTTEQKELQKTKNIKTVKRRPIQNNAILARINNQNVETTLARIKSIEMQEDSEIKITQLPPQIIETKPTSSDFPAHDVPKQIQKKEILEITGSQNKLGNQTKNLLRPPTKSDNFVISTSPSYIGVNLEEARQMLSKFGSVRIVKVGDMFALKISPKQGLATELEAKEFLKNIIKGSFFDVYVEKL